MGKHMNCAYVNYAQWCFRRHLHHPLCSATDSLSLHSLTSIFSLLSPVDMEIDWMCHRYGHFNFLNVCLRGKKKLKVGQTWREDRQDPLCTV